MMSSRHSVLTGVILAMVTAALAISAGGARASDLARCHDAHAALCGTVQVAVDRSDPLRGTIPIFFRVMRHTGNGPVADPILATEGGPGYSVTQNNWQGYASFAFGPLRPHHDLVFIDQRGVGLSRAIDCALVQGGVTGSLNAAFAKCAAHLGATANDYGSGDVALDIDAVRAAVGIDKFTFYGASYAAVDVQAYAARFPQHLDAVVLDSPAKIVDLDDLARSTPPAMLRAVALICRRSATCSAAQSRPGEEFRWLARRLRRHPVVGTGIDSSGKPRHVRVTEGFLAWRIMQNTDGPFVVFSEIPAAAAALRAGDRVPLLRLAADSAGPLIGPFSGDHSSAPSAFSGGDNTARYCTGGDAGVLRVMGREMTAGRLQITGRLAGRHVALSVPIT